MEKTPENQTDILKEKIKSIYTHYTIPLAATVLLLFTFHQIRSVTGATVHIMQINSQPFLQGVMLFMILFSLFLPINHTETHDKLLKKLPIHYIDGTLLLSLFSFILVHNNLRLALNAMVENRNSFLFLSNANVIYLFGFLWISLVSCSYTVTQIKIATHQEFKEIADQLLLVQLWKKMPKAELKKKQTFKLFLFFLSQYVVFVFLVAIAINSPNHISNVLFLLAPLYLIALFLICNKKITNIRQQYLRLHKMVEEIGDGNFDAPMPESVGYFNSLVEELQNIKEGLEQAIARTMKSERMKGDLITNVSHDLKTPLTALITYVELLQQKGISEEKRDLYLNILAQKSERLSTLIEDLFEVSKASSGNLQLEIADIDVVTLMKQTLSGLHDQIERANLILRVSYPEMPTIVPLDGARMHRVFENLIVNMTKYSLSGTRIYVDIISKENTTTIIFRNIIAEEIAVATNELTERFVRGEQSRKTSGSGLGLAIAKSFVESQNGAFDVQVDGDLFKVLITFMLNSENKAQ